MSRGDRRLPGRRRRAGRRAERPRHRRPGPARVRTYWLERAWTGAGEVRDGVLRRRRGRRVHPGRARPGRGAERLAGLTVPGLANCHSHAFHRALRGRTQRGARDVLDLARADVRRGRAGSTPDTYFELARATYREMASVGITSVGEFHYLHHGPGGTPYDDPNAMSHALVEAAREAGIRIALLDTCYLAAGIGRPPEGVQARFSDGDADAWAARLSRRPVTTAAVHAARTRRRDGSTVRWGAAIHSVRAVPREQMPTVVAWADRARRAAARAPVRAGRRERRLPGGVRRDADRGARRGRARWGERTSAVHATHLTDRRRRAARRLAHARLLLPHHRARPRRRHRPVPRGCSTAGAPLTLGSDSHAVIDLFEEMRAVELDERLATRERGHWSADELLRAATYDGHAVARLRRAGRIEVGARADLVTLDTASVAHRGHRRRRGHRRVRGRRRRRGPRAARRRRGRHAATRREVGRRARHG